MANIGKVSGIDTSLDDSYRRTAENKKQERTKPQQHESFSDIYDVRLLSAELNRNSTEFKLSEVREANVRLKDVIENMVEFKSDDIVVSYPSEEIIALSEMAKNSIKKT